MAYTTEKIRNICLLGHGGDGKTSLVESLLYMTGNTVWARSPTAPRCAITTRKR